MKNIRNVKTPVQCVFLWGGSLKTSLARVFSLVKSEHLFTIKRIAFTMAEILLSLTIIGVVAAITLPSLTGNINERTWNTQRKALYSRMSQAVALLPQLRGYGSFSTDNNGNVSVSSNAGEVFLTSGLNKVLKLNNVCDNAHLEDCGMPNAFKTFASGSNVYLSDIKTFGDLAFDQGHCGVLTLNLDTDTIHATAFETANGESVMVYYNPTCTPKGFLERLINVSWGYIDSYGFLCANFVYDLNGKKGPNMLGKDVGFMSLFYNDEPTLVAPEILTKKAISAGSFASLQSACGAQDARVPNLEEAMSVGMNKSLVGFLGKSGSVTSKVLIDQSSQKRRVSFDIAGNNAIWLRDSGEGYCIKR